jgi:hypothetical protein
MSAYGVYKVLANGDHVYVSRTVTTNEKLAQELADDFTRGEIVMPDGRIRHITPVKCIAKEIGT